MRIIIGGAGEVGCGLARSLIAEGKIVVLIDSNPRAVKDAQALDALVIQGDITHRSNLEDAGIADAKAFVAATESDEKNLIACALAKHARSVHDNSKNTSDFISIARVNDQQMIEESKSGYLNEWCGIEHVVSPIEDSVNRLISGLKSTSFEEVINLGFDAYIVELELNKSATDLVYSTIEEAAERIGGLPNIVAIKRKGTGSFVPSNTTELLPGDSLAVATIGESTFQRIIRLTGNEEPDFPSKPRVLIFGANEIGKRLAIEYISKGSRVTIIEEELVVANKLAGSKLGDNRLIDVIHGEYRDIDLLKEIDAGSHDIALAALDDDHASIAVALLVSDLGTKRTGLILSSHQLTSVVKRMGITFAVTKKKVAVDAILSKIHGNLPGPYGILSSIPEIRGMSAPLLLGSKYIGSTIGDLPLESKYRCKVAFIQREVKNKIITISAQEHKELHLNDRLLLFLPQDKVSAVEKELES